MSFPNVTDEEYFADKMGVDEPCFSYSTAKILLAKSPAHAYLFHPKGGGKEKTATKGMDFGAIIHAVLLGKGGKVAIIEHDNYRTKDAQRQRDEAVEQGLIPMLTKEWNHISAASTAISQRLTTHGVSLEGKPEQAVLWKQAGTQCKGRMDLWQPQQELITELKITDWPLTQRSLERLIIQMGYDVQLGAYKAAMKAHEIDASFRWIFIESQEPYSVVVAYASDLLQELGKTKWERAVSEWERCLHSGIWPTYKIDAVLDAPIWALREYEINLYPVTEIMGGEYESAEKPEGVDDDAWF